MSGKAGGWKEGISVDPEIQFAAGADELLPNVTVNNYYCQINYETEQLISHQVDSINLTFLWHIIIAFVYTFTKMVYRFLRYFLFACRGPIEFPNWGQNLSSGQGQNLSPPSCIFDHACQCYNRSRVLSSTGKQQWHSRQSTP